MENMLGSFTHLNENVGSSYSTFNTKITSLHEINNIESFSLKNSPRMITKSTRKVTTRQDHGFWDCRSL